MPNIQPDASAVRAPGHSIRVHASFYVGAVVAQGTVAADALNGTYYVLVNPATIGDLADAIVGMEVVFYTSTGAFKGRTHISYHDTPIGLDYFTIREQSFGSFQVIAGDIYQIRREWRLHDKLVAALDTFPPDYLIYTDQNDAPDPVTCSGGDYAAYIDGYYTQTIPEVYATVQFTGSTSYTVDPDSGGTGTHAWTFPAGSTPTTSTAADPSVQIPVGSWIVQHDFTDDDNGKTTTQYIAVMIHDDTFSPYELMLDDGIQTDEQYGWRATARLFQDATLDDIPDGTLALLWTDERMDGDWQSFGNATPGRENMLVVGYTHADNNSADASLRKIYFDIVSPLQRLDEIAGYSKVLEQSETPDSWSTYKTLDTQRATIQLLYRYTTLIESGFDLIFDAAYLNKLYPALYLQRSTPLQQVRELCHGVDARLTCDPSGRFDIYTHPPYIPLADRAAVTVTFTLAKEDIIDFSFVRSHYDKVELMKTSGFSAGLTGNSPIFSLYPGNAPNEATDAPTSDRLICGDETDGSGAQDDLNDRTGRYGALNDMTFIDGDGFKQRAFELHLTLFGSYNFFRLYHEYVAFTLDGSSNLRGVDISTSRFWVKSVQVTFDGGTARVKLVLVAETNAPAGITYTPPSQGQTYFPPTNGTPSQPPISYLPPVGILGRGTATLAFLDTQNELYDGYLPAASPVWERSAPSLSGSVLMWIQNAFTPADAILITTTQGRSISDIFGTQTLGTAHSFAFTTDYRSMQSERGVNGFFLVVSYRTSGGGGSRFDVDLTLDSGGSWTQHTSVAALGTWVGGTGDQNHPGCYVSAGTPGKVLVGGYTGAGATTGAIFVSLDYGATWARLNSFSFAEKAKDIHCPYQNENIVYHGGANSGSGHQAYRLFRSSTTAQTDISPTDGGETFGTENTFGVKTCDADYRSVLLVGRNWDSGHTIRYGVWLSRDGGDIWTVLVAPGSGVLWRGGNFGSDRNTIFLWGNGVITMSIDGGASFSIKTGNLGSFTSPTAGTITNIIGK